MYACLVPVFGMVPAVITLVSDRPSQKLKDVAVVAIMAGLLWGAGTANSQELVKGSLSSVYFIVNIYLMWRLAQGKKVSLRS